MATDAIVRARLQAFCEDKGLAQLGDSFVNLVYSLAKSRASGSPVGEKVPDKVLSEALELSRLPVPARLKHGERGNIVEAALAHAWMGNMITVDGAAAVLQESLAKMEFKSASLEREIAAKAFSKLFKEAVVKILLSEGTG